MNAENILDEFEELEDLDPAIESEVTVQESRADSQFARSPGDSPERTELLDLREACLSNERNCRRAIADLDKEIKALQVELRSQRETLAVFEKRRDSIERQLVRVKRIANGERVTGRRPKVGSEPANLAQLIAHLTEEERQQVFAMLAGV